MVKPLKDAKTYQEQIDNLINNHGLIITDRAIAERILSNVNYYRLSAFGIGLKQKADKEKYQEGIFGFCHGSCFFHQTGLFAFPEERHQPFTVQPSKSTVRASILAIMSIYS